jgi:hypothetical protein
MNVRLIGLIQVSGETDKLLDIRTVWKMGRLSSYRGRKSEVLSSFNARRTIPLNNFR